MGLEPTISGDSGQSSTNTPLACWVHNLHRGFWPLCHLNWAKVRTKATASEFDSYNPCEDADMSGTLWTRTYGVRVLTVPASSYAHGSAQLSRLSSHAD